MERGYGSNRFVSFVTTFGRNPLFFYLVHLWLYRFRLPRQMPPFYFSLSQTVVVWGVGLIVLRFLTDKYAGFKRTHQTSFLRYI
jgi:hypothetical protein